MPERVVSDAERVAACRSLWGSRFPERDCTMDDIISITGLTRERVLTAEQPPPMRTPKLKPERTESLPCVECGGRFDRVVQRGKKPTRCPSCR